MQKARALADWELEEVNGGTNTASDTSFCPWCQTRFEYTSSEKRLVKTGDVKVYEYKCPNCGTWQTLREFDED